MLLENHMFNFLRFTREGTYRKKSSGNRSSSEFYRETHTKTGVTKLDLFGSVLSLSLFLNQTASAASSTISTVSLAGESLRGTVDEATKNGEKLGDNITEKDNPVISLHDSISYLLSYLATKSFTKDQSLFSKVHIAGMLFPWSIHALLYLSNSNNEA